MANSLFNPPFFTAMFQGKVATGAKMFFYQTETLVPIAIYDADGDPAPNPLSANLFGQFPAVYLADATQEFRVKLTTASGELIDDIDPDDNILGIIKSSGGSAFIGYTPPGGNYKTNLTVKNELDKIVWVDNYTGTADQAVTSALSAGSTVVFTAGSTNVFSAAVTVPAGKIVDLNGARVEAVSGFTGNNLFVLAGNSRIIGPGSIDGTNLLAPTGAYTSGTYRGVGVFWSGTQIGGLIQDVLFTNFPSGPILANSASAPSNVIVNRCLFIGNQTYTGGETNALCHFHAVSYGRQIDCYATDYNWKGFYVANGNFNQIVRCHTNGGVIGHAAHYISGGADNEIVDCTHSGAGFGFKCFTSTRPKVINYTSTSSYNGGFMQGCTDFVVDGVLVYDPVVSVMDLDGFTGITCSGLINNIRGSRAATASGINQCGIRINLATPGAFDGLTIRNCRLRNQFFGIQSANATVSMLNINIDDNDIGDVVQYGILGYFGSGRLHGNKIGLRSGAISGWTIDGDNVNTGGVFETDDNEVDGATGANAQIGNQGSHIKWAQFSGSRNSFTAGTTGFLIDLTASTSDFIKEITLDGNIGTGMTTGTSGYQLVANTVTTTLLKAEVNLFSDTAGAELSDSVSNVTSVSVRGTFKYSGSPAATFNAPRGTLYINRSGGTGTTLYVNETGGTGGWVAK